MMKQLLCTICIGVFGMVEAASAACISISSIPTTITVSGSYCLSKSLILPSTAPYTGIAVTIAANNVILDLQGHSLIASSPAYGVYSNGYVNITVRNGRLSGFSAAVWLYNNQVSSITDPSVPGNYLVEKLIVRDSHQDGIIINNGGNSTVQDNIVSNTGADSYPNTFTIAIQVVSNGGLPVTVQNNIVDKTHGSGTANGVGAEGIIVFDATASTIANNTILDTTAGSDKAIGIVYQCEYSYCANSTITALLNNNVINSSPAPTGQGNGQGILIAGNPNNPTAKIATVRYSDIENFPQGLVFINSTGGIFYTKVAGATTPFTGGINVTGNEAN